MTLIVLFPLYIAVWCLSRLRAWKRSESAKSDCPSSRQSEGIQLALLIILGVLILNATYRFSNACVPLQSLTFYSRFLGGNLEETGEVPESKYTKSGNRFRNTLLGPLPCVLPAPYLQGFDIQRRDFEGGWRSYDSYAAGIKAKHGWWWYYFYCVVVKCPLAGVCLIILAIPSTLRWLWFELAELKGSSQIVISMCIAILVVSETSFSRCFRYLLVVWPFFIVAISTAFSDYAKPIIRKAATLTLIAYVATSFAATPQHLSFFNSFVGGPMGGHTALLDSNLDWGQELFRLRAWRTQHPSDSLFLATSGMIDPGILGIAYGVPPVSTPNVVPQLPPGWYIVSANVLHGFDANAESFEYFQRLQPVDRIGHTMFVFRIAP